MDQHVNSADELLQPGDPAPFEEINRDGPTPMLLLCDHASRRVPLALGDLGLEASSFDRHIAYDIGAESVSQRLSTSLDAPLVAAGFSRLVSEHFPLAIHHLGIDVVLRHPKRVCRRNMHCKLLAEFRQFIGICGRF